MNLFRRHYTRGIIYILLRYLFRIKYINPYCRIVNARFKCFAADGIGRHLYKYGMHEKHNTLFLKNHLSLKKNEIALDIGSNLGWYSVLLSRVASNQSIIYSFEPDIENYKLLKHNILFNKCENVTTYNLAVSESKGESLLYKYPIKNAGRHSLIPQKGYEETSVKTTSLDLFLSDSDKMNVKFIKIDIEGYEYFALLGARKTLSYSPMIMMEYSPKLYLKEFSSGKLLELISEFSYRIFILKNGELVQISYDDLNKINYQIDIFLQK